MAYKLMTRLIANYKNGEGSYIKERLMELLDVYLAADRISTEQYEKLMISLNPIEKVIEE